MWQIIIILLYRDTTELFNIGKTEQQIQGMKWRDALSICGYCAETSLETCSKDLSKLWLDFDAKKEELFNLFGYRNDFYGLMWSTGNGMYCYLIGIEIHDINKSPVGTCCKCVVCVSY